MEDLWCFNDEGVARAIYDSEIPVISAVGHEPDVTIADFVADCRAATPSNGAELAVPDQNEQYELLDHLTQRMVKAAQRRLGEYRTVMLRASRCRMLQDPMSWVRDHRLLLERQESRLSYIAQTALKGRRKDMARLAAGLDALSPLKVIGRGYAMAQGPKGLLRSVKDVKAGDEVRLRLADGSLRCEVKGGS